MKCIKREMNKIRFQEKFREMGRAQVSLFSQQKFGKVINGLRVKVKSRVWP